MPDETPMTPKGLREKARQIREMAEARILEIREAAEQEARECERAAAVIERVQSGLPRDASYATIETMATAAATKPPLTSFRRGAPLESDGPVATVAKKLRVPAAEIARRLGVNPITARNWDKRGKIPHLDIREKLAAMVAAAEPEAKPKKARHS